ncbi:MAG: hypothetical protein Q8O13_03775 [Candidatus Omnitrophota bacterium]|nr:hypothetical protein [Candidatus Omnitrophota bacterium]
MPPLVINILLMQDSKFQTSFQLHNIKFEIISNSKFLLKLINGSFKSLKCLHREKIDFTLTYHLKAVEDYKQIPVLPEDGFIQLPLFQQEYLKDNKLCLIAGLRTIRISVTPQKNLIEVYVVSGQKIDNDLLFDLIFFQPLKFLLGFHKLYLLHSSCVARDSQAILFPGQSESGKSILALSLVRNGFKYISDDDTILRQNGNQIECLSFPTEIKIKNSLIKYFPEIKKKFLSPTHKTSKRKIDIQKVYPGSVEDNAIPRLIIFPKFREASKTEIKPVSKKEALHYLIKDDFKAFRGQYEEIAKQHFQILSNLVQQAKTYQLFYKDCDINKIPKIVSSLL